MTQKAIDALYGKFLAPHGIITELTFFKDKYHKYCPERHPARLKMLPDLIRACDVIFNSAAILEQERVYEELVRFCRDNHSRYGRELEPIKLFLDTMDKLRDFYELNKNSPIKDKRSLLMAHLRARILLLIRFLDNCQEQKTIHIFTKSFLRDIEEREGY